MALREHNVRSQEKKAHPNTAVHVRKKLRALRQTACHHLVEFYRKVLIRTILRQKPLSPSKDGRHVPLRVDRNAPLLDERRGQPYISNTIRTSRYTIYDFLPMQLYFQFTRLANVYFLAVGIPQTIPGLSTTGSYTTILPLVFFVLLTVVKEGYDDYKRHRLDQIENAYTATVLRSRAEEQHATTMLSRIWHPSKPRIAEAHVEAGEQTDSAYAWTRVRWHSLRVGDIVRLSRDEPVPADLVLLFASGEDGIAYFDTMDLDGETNLKSKEALSDLEACDTIPGLRATDAELVVEDPNPDLYNFDGKMTIHGRTLPLTSNQVVYRGSTLRNTKSVVGVVINTGEECKIRMNANQHPQAKKPLLEAIINKIVITLALYVIVLSVGCSIGYIIWRGRTERHSWYISIATVEFKQIIIGYAIMYNNVIPLALYVTLEITRIGQALMLNADLEMYDEATDTPARCNTNTILENLGQVSYVFSDKTGTLTDNIMKFRKMSVSGTIWLHETDLEPRDSVEAKSCPRIIVETTTPRTSSEVLACTEETIGLSPLSSPTSSYSPPPERRSSSQWRSTGCPDHLQPDLTTTDLLEYIRRRPSSLFARRARDYILCMALCHTCLPEMKDGMVDFQASSPDELALVRAAKELGYAVTQRSSQSITLRITDVGDRVEVYEVLDVIEFSSKRKRMSIIVRHPDGRICIICKGADSALMPRLRLAHIATQKAAEVRKSADLEHELIRRSEQQEIRNSFGGRPSPALRRSIALNRSTMSPRASHDGVRRPVISRSKSAEASRPRVSGDNKPRPSLGLRTASLDVSKFLSVPNSSSPDTAHDKFKFLDDPSITDESITFSRCFKHLDDFAMEGLRTLMFARRFISETDYIQWKQAFNEATTSLVNRQDKIEEVAETIEQGFDLVGATAIEDKLQAGVPETIDKLRRANIKIWMLTGDKRETAINIAHSARICRPGSDIYILDSTKGSLETQINDVMEDIRTDCIHSAVVVDGQTLAVVEQSPLLTELFYTLIPTVDSVICCRASPAQKSTIVKAVRSRLPNALTLAIGDGANDLAMISASHVGVGISGKEGLQAARVADYAIAQFRFLQRLLLVHGRWNYVRTAKFVLATFWKELFFYLPTALYQQYNGYTGTSLYDSWSLTVFNILFTGLAVVCMGIWEQDLSAETLLAVPELYVHGQRNGELNIPRFLRWVAVAAAEGVLVWFGVWASYCLFGRALDDGLFAVGDLVFTVCVIWINWKLLIIETHHKTAVVLGAFAISFAGWWFWQLFLSGAGPYQPTPYAIRDGFIRGFGNDPLWWLTVIIVVVALIVLEYAFKSAKRNLIVAGLWRWPPWKSRREEELEEDSEEWNNRELWQELEQDPLIRERLRRARLEEDEDDNDERVREGTVDVERVSRV